jgi:hypothetical protein
MCPIIGSKAGPVRDGAVPFLAAVLWCERTVLEIGESDFIRSDHASSCATFDGHVADGHSGLHAEAANRRSAEFNDGAGSASGANDANDVENDVLAGHARGQVSVNLHTHVLAPSGSQGLGGEDVLDLGGANAKGQGTEGTMRGRVAVATDDGGARKREALLRTNDVDNSLALVAQSEVGQAKVLDVFLQRNALGARLVLFDKGLDIAVVASRRSRDVLERLAGKARGGVTNVIDGCKSAIWTSNGPPSSFQALKGLLRYYQWGQEAIPDDAYGRGDLVDEMPVYGGGYVRHECMRQERCDAPT